MAELDARIAGLSPEKREMLLRWMAAERVEEAGAEPAVAALPELVPRDEARYEPFALTPVQQTYWAGRSGLYDLAGAGTNIYQELELVGPYAPAMERVHQALQKVIGHHDMLRAELAIEGGEVLQRILPSVPDYRIEVDDLRSLDRETAEEEIDRLRQEMCTRTAPVDRWPLFEIRGQRLDEDRVRLHTRFEPFLMDGEGRAHVIYQLFRLFEDPSFELPSIGCTYRDYAVTWNELGENPLFRAARDYWLARVPDLPPAPELPLVTELAPETPPAFVRKRFTLEPELWRELKRRGGQRGLTPSAVILAAFGDVLVRWSGELRFTLCAVGSYRPPLHPDIHEVVGNFNTITPLEIDAREECFAERAARLQERITADLEYPYFSGFEMLRALNKERGMSSRPFLPVWFNSVVEYSHPTYQREASGMVARGDLGEIRYLDLIMYPPQSCLLTTAGESADGSMWAIWQWIEQLFPEGMVQDMAAAYGRALRRLALDAAAWTSRGTVVTLPEELCAPGAPGLAVAAERNPAGRSLAETERVQVVGPWSEPCPPWTVGRVVAVDEGDGAVSDSVSTARSLIGRRRADGVVEILGAEGESRARILRYTVDLADVAAEIETLPEIDEAVVLPSGRGLVAHVTAAGGELEPVKVLAELRNRLSYYEVPLRMVVWDDLARTVTGAPDCSRLAEADLGDVTLPRPPDSAIAEMAAVWKDVLGRAPKDDEDDFFTLGGDSLSVVRLVHAVEARFGITLPAAAVFMEPTLLAMTRAVHLTEPSTRRETH